MPLFTGKELMAYGTTKHEPEHNNPKEIQHQLFELAKPLLNAVQERINRLEKACLDSFYELDMDLWAWDVLPHKAVADSLMLLYPLMDQVRDAIKHGTLLEVEASAKGLTRFATEVFAVVEEFLASRLSRMGKKEWTSLENWSEMRVAGHNHDHYWVIGDHVRPSEYALMRKQFHERELADQERRA